MEHTCMNDIRDPTKSYTLIPPEMMSQPQIWPGRITLSADKKFALLKRAVVSEFKRFELAKVRAFHPVFYSLFKNYFL